MEEERQIQFQDRDRGQRFHQHSNTEDAPCELEGNRRTKGNHLNVTEESESTGGPPLPGLGHRLVVIPRARHCWSAGLYHGTRPLDPSTPPPSTSKLFLVLVGTETEEDDVNLLCVHTFAPLPTAR